jgi:hypothetical protein
MKDETPLHNSDPNANSKMRPSRKEERIPVYKETVKDVNAKILKITAMIREQYPELGKQLDEMPEASLDAQNENNLEALKYHYELLTTMLNKYKLEHYYKSK